MREGESDARVERERVKGMPRWRGEGRKWEEESLWKGDARVELGGGANGGKRIERGGW